MIILITSFFCYSHEINAQRYLEGIILIFDICKGFSFTCIFLRSNKTSKNFRYRTFSKFLKITIFCFSFCISPILDLVFCARLQMDLFQRKGSVYLETIVLRGFSYSWKIFNNRLISMLTGFQRKLNLQNFWTCLHRQFFFSFF